jgi:hypothetical protein
LKPKETIYPRNRRFIAAMPLIAVVCFLAGAASLVFGISNQAIVWWVLAGLWWANYLLSRKTPFIVLSDEALTLFPSPVLPRKVIPWRHMVRMRRLAGSRCQLFLSNGRRIHFRLFWVDAKQRQSLIENIEAAIAQTGAEGLTQTK